MKKGYTLIELLVFLALTGIFLVVTTQLLQSVVDFKLESSSSSAVDMNGNYLYTRLKYDLRRATSISTPASANQTSNSLTIIAGGSTLTYTVSSGRLLLSTSIGSLPLSDNSVQVQNFSVTRTGGVASQSIGVQVKFDVESVEQTTGSLHQKRSWQFSSILR